MKPWQSFVLGFSLVTFLYFIFKTSRPSEAVLLEENREEEPKQQTARKEYKSEVKIIPKSSLPHSTVLPARTDPKLISPDHTTLQIENPKDANARPLPKCSADNIGTTPYGSYPFRNYYSIIETCEETFVEQNLYCISAGDPIHIAPTYTSDGTQICRCGGFPFQPETCLFIKKMKFHYHKNPTTAAATEEVSIPNCKDSTHFEEGRFREGRYIPPTGCDLLDITPKNLLKYFPNKVFLMEGDAHQTEHFLGLVAEIRNQRFLVNPIYSNRWGHEIRYEVTENEDLLEYFFQYDLKFDENTSKCKLQSPCTIFIHRNDRFASEFERTILDISNFPPDYLISAFVSIPYLRQANSEKELESLKKTLETFLKNKSLPSQRFAWTYSPREKPEVTTDLIETWLRNVESATTIVRSKPFWLALEQSPEEPGLLTQQLTWLGLCKVSGKESKTQGTMNSLIASEACTGPVARTVYRVILSIFASKN